MQQDTNITNSQLLDELKELRQRNAELETIVSNLKETNGPHKESDERFRAIAESSIDGMCIIGQDCTIDFWNKAAEEIFGYEEKDVLGKSYLMLIPERLRDRDLAMRQNYLNTGRLTYHKKPFEIKALRKDGSECLVEAAFSGWEVNGKRCLSIIIRDTAERKQQEMALQEREERFKAVAESSSDAIFLSDQNGAITFWNKAAANMFGYEDGGIIGKSYTMLLPERLRAQDQEAWQQFLKTGMISSYKKPLETVALRKDGSEFPIEMTFSSWKVQGQYCFCFIVRDITERKQHEEVLKNSEERFRSIAETSSDAIYISDQDGSIIFWNKAAAKIFGYEGKEILGKSETILMPMLMSKGHSEAREELIQKGTMSFMPKTIEAVAVRKGGTEFPVEIANSAWKIKGRYYFSTILRDITERKQTEALLRESEKRFKDIFDFAIDGILIADSQTRKFQGANRAMCQMLGYSLEELINLGTENIHPVECLPSVFEYFEKMVKGNIFNAIELPTLRKDGSVFYADINARPMVLDGKQCLVGIFRDVTERKQQEAALQEREERFRAISESTPDAIFITDGIGKVLYANKSVERVYGYTAEELLGKSLDVIEPERMRPISRKNRERLVKGESSHYTGKTFEGIAVCKGGVEFPVEISISFWRIGDQPYFCGIARDITQRKKQEAALKESEERFRAIAESSPDAMLTTDSNGGILYCNNSVENIFSYTAEELVGKSIEVIVPSAIEYIVRKKGGSLAKESYQPYSGKTAEGIGIRKDGTAFAIEASSSHWEIEGRLFFSGIIRDITQRKKQEEALKTSEARFRAIAESSLDAIITSDSSGKILYWNKAAETIYGYKAEEMVGKKSVQHLLPERRRPIEREARGNVIRTGQFNIREQPMEALSVKKDGTEFTTESSFSSWEEGGQIFFSGIIRDITKRKQMEEQLRKSHDELEKKVKQRTVELAKANKELQSSKDYLKKFAGMLLSVREEERKNISTALHDELGSMAISVDSSISIAKEEVKDNNRDAAIEALKKAQAALRKAVGDLRTLAVDLRPPNLGIVGLASVLNDFIDKFRNNSTFKIVFKNDLAKKKISDDMGIVIYRVIQEALTNITKHAKAQKVSVSLYSDKNKVHLDITDDGVGFDVDKVSKRKGRLKIGIQGMRERVESFGGEFIITSESKRGTQIKATLPK